MTREQINQRVMAGATNTFLDSHVAVWTPIPIVSNYKTTLVQAIEGIDTAAQLQESSQVYIGSSIRDLKWQIAQKMDILDDSLEAFAADTENVELLAKADNSATDYFRLSHEEFEIKTKNVIDLLDVHVASMTDYGMSPAQIEEVRTSFTAFQDKRDVPRSYQIQSRMATTDLEALFEEMNKALDRLDNVLKRFKRSDPSFYQGYSAARTIVHN